MPELLHNFDAKSRLLAKVTRDLLTCGSFADLADLADALKARCARLHISFAADDISEAFRVIASNRSLVEEPFAGLEIWRPFRLALPEPRGLSPEDAKEIYRAVLVRYEQEHPVCVDRTHWPDDFPALVQVMG